jgi:hypothetical protein
MERRIEAYLNNEKCTKPYLNHYGNGSAMGGGSISGNGKAFTNIEVKDNFNGSNIISFNGKKVYMVNGLPMNIIHIHEPWAIGEIIKKDLTTQKCYLGRINNHLVVGNSISEVLEKLRIKIAETNDNITDIATAFVVAHPDYNKQYNWGEMVMWHSLDRTSCASGRQSFSARNNKFSCSTASPKELVEFMKDSKAVYLANKIEEIYLKKLK